jgi:hypothetical protein
MEDVGICIMYVYDHLVYYSTIWHIFGHLIYIYFNDVYVNVHLAMGQY